MTLDEIATPRMRLRRARASDLAALNAVLSDPRATRYWSTAPHADLDATRAWLDAMLASPPELSEDFVVEREGHVIGKAGFYRLPEIGFILHADHWGVGLAREAVGAVVDHVFETRALDALTADVDPRNAAAIGLLGRLGFEKTGAEERTYCIAGEWTDSAYYALSREQWSRGRAR